MPDCIGPGRPGVCADTPPATTYTLSAAAIIGTDLCLRGGGETSGTPPPPRSLRSSGQPKNLEDAGVLRHLGEHPTEERRVVIAGQPAPAGHDRDVLLAVGAVADDAAVVPLTVVVLPQLLARGRIVRAQPATRIRNEHQLA